MNLKRILTMLLVVAMVLGTIYVPAIADEVENVVEVIEDSAVSEVEDVEETDEEPVEEVIIEEEPEEPEEEFELMAEEDVVYVAYIGETGYESLEKALDDAKTNGLTDVEITVTGDIKLTDAIKDFTKVTFNGTNREQTVDMNLGRSIDVNTELVFNDLTISRLDSDWLYHYTYIRGGLTYDNCKMVGLFNVTIQDTTFNKCDFYNDDTFGKGNYSLWLSNCAEGVEVNITDCTFNVYERAIKMYGDGYNGAMTLDISGTTFTSRTVNKTVVEMAYDNADKGTGSMALNIDEKSSATGFGKPEHIEGTENAWYNVECVLENKQAGDIGTYTDSTVTIDNEVVYRSNTPAVTVVKTDGTKEFFDSLAVAMDEYPFSNLVEKFVINEDITEDLSWTTDEDKTNDFPVLNGIIESGKEEGVTITNTVNNYIYMDSLTIGKGVHIVSNGIFFQDGDNCVEGTIKVIPSEGVYYQSGDAKVKVQNGGKVIVDGTTIIRYNEDPEAGLYIYGDNNAETVEFSCSYYIGAYSGTFYVKDANVEAGYFLLKNSYDVEKGYTTGIDMVLDNSTVKTVGTSDGQNQFITNEDASITMTNGSKLDVKGDYIATETVKVSTDETSSISAENLVTNAEELKAAVAKENVTVVLANDIGLGEDWSCEVGKGTTIDGNGKTLTVESVYHGDHNAAFYSDGSYKVQNLTITCTCSGEITAAAFDVRNGGTLTNVTVNGGFQMGVYVETGDVTVTGCTFENASWGVYNEDKKDCAAVITNNTFNSLRAAKLMGTETFTGNTVNGAKGLSVATENATITGNVFAEGSRVECWSNADLSGNYWGGSAPSETQLTVDESVADTVTATAESWYTEVAEDGTLDGLTSSSIMGTGTKADPYIISSLDALKKFRDDVNAGNNYAGKYVKLTADIDLNDEEWTPIGYMGKTFLGTFDGGNNTIKNLVITKTFTNSAENNGIGLFGRTDSPAVIQNLTIENVDITGSLYVGAVVGWGYTGNKIENVTVQGDIAIDAWWYAGVIGGNGYMNLVNNCHVIGNDDSYIKGNDGSYIGGIWGFRGEGSQKITNCSVTNLSITGVDRVGGIAGIGHYGNEISDCKADDVTVTATDPEATTIGLIVGATQGTEGSPTTFTDNDVEGVTAQIDNGDGTYTNVTNLYGTNINGSTSVTNYVAKIGSAYYETLAAALEAAQDGETIELIAGENQVVDMKGAVYGKTVTITGTATVDWNQGYLFVGRGGEGDGTVIFDKANLTSASNSSSYGIHVSGRQKNEDEKYNGTLEIKDSAIELDYLINRGTINVNNSTLTVKNGFGIAGRPASETESGEAATATITLDNNSKVIVNNHNGMGIGQASIDPEGYGIMDVKNGSTFECTQDFLITENGTMNINGGNVKIAGTLTNKGTLKSNGNIYGAFEKAADTAVIEITGGTYTQDPSAYLADGAQAIYDSMTKLYSVVGTWKVGTVLVDEEEMKEVYAGETVKVAVKVDGANFTGAEWELKYNKDLFKYLSTTEIDGDEDIVKLDKEGNETGIILGLAYDANAKDSYTSDTQLAIYEFEAIEQTEIKKDTFDIKEASVGTMDMVKTSLPAAGIGDAAEVTILLKDFDVTVNHVVGEEVKGEVTNGAITIPYDNEEHKIVVETEPDAPVYYKNGEDWTTEAPVFTEYGDYEVTYKVDVPAGYDQTAKEPVTITVKIGDATDYEIEVAKYVDEYKLILVHTNVEKAYFRYDNSEVLMLDVTAAGYNYKDEEGNVATDEYEHVYGYVVPAIMIGEEEYADDQVYKNKVEFVYGGTVEKGPASVDPYDYDINCSEPDPAKAVADLADVIYTNGVYNHVDEVMVDYNRVNIDKVILESYMKRILKADAYRDESAEADKKVNLEDVAPVKAEYLTNR